MRDSQAEMRKDEELTSNNQLLVVSRVSGRWRSGRCFSCFFRTRLALACKVRFRNIFYSVSVSFNRLLEQFLENGLRAMEFQNGGCN